MQSTATCPPIGSTITPTSHITAPCAHCGRPNPVVVIVGPMTPIDGLSTVIPFPATVQPAAPMFAAGHTPLWATRAAQPTTQPIARDPSTTVL